VKKIIVILLLFVYSASAFSIAINSHYCQGHLTKISVLNFGGHRGCNCNPKDMPKGCCKDKLHFTKVNIHKGAQVNSLLVAGIYFDIEPSSLYNNCFIPLNDGLNFGIAINKIDRSCSQPPIFLLNRTFRI